MTEHIFAGNARGLLSYPKIYAPSLHKDLYRNTAEMVAPTFQIHLLSISKGILSVCHVHSDRHVKLHCTEFLKRKLYTQAYSALWNLLRLVPSSIEITPRLKSAACSTRIHHLITWHITRISRRRSTGCGTCLCTPEAKFSSWMQMRKFCRKLRSSSHQHIRQTSLSEKQPCETPKLLHSYNNSRTN